MSTSKKYCNEFLRFATYISKAIVSILVNFNEIADHNQVQP